MSSKKADRVERPQRGDRIGYRMERTPRIDPALLESFERELTADVARRLLELASRRVAMLRAAGIHVVSDEARLLVQESFTATLSQEVRWQPGETPLAAHLSGLVRRRSWAKLAQARKLRAMAIELVTSPPGPATPSREAAPSREPAPSRDASDEANLPAPLLPIWRHGALELVQQVLAGLSAHDAEDAAVRLLLEAYCDGAATRAEVLAASGLSLDDYVGARRRLDRLLAALPEPQLESALSAMWRAR